MSTAETDGPVRDHGRMANAIRMLAADAVQAANSGHPGMPMGMADVATVLFTRFLKFDPTVPDWPDRDRFVLSAGHGSMLQYALLYLTGYADVDRAQIAAFRQLHSRTPGHPEAFLTRGVETTTGPLGQGLANAVGMALAERMLNARFGDDLVDHRTYVIAGDGDLMEGISHEAISLAGHLRLHKLTVFWDDNGISIDGRTALAVSDDQLARVRACGWDGTAVDGHDPVAVGDAIIQAQQSDRPFLIACRTTIGYGAPTKAGSEKAHGAALGAEELAGLRQHLDWPHAPFDVPEPILAVWREAGLRGQAPRQAWQRRLAAVELDRRGRFETALAGTLPEGWQDVLTAFKRNVCGAPPKVPTRKASQDVLEHLVKAVPTLIGGSADLTGSNLTKAKEMERVAPGDYGGRYIHYGVREFAMAAAVNGLALHGGFIPYCGTFLVFADYMRNAMRLSALMGLRVVYVLTHDSIGVGEDGPTHQPVEHLAMLRATPQLTVFRPADSVETAECWALALSEVRGPSVLALSRQPLPTVRVHHTAQNRCAQGGYVLEEADGPRRVTLIATGSEVAVAKRARELLQGNGIGAAMVSLPSWELFEAQPAAYRSHVLGGAGVLRVAIEAAAPFGWERYVGPDGLIIALPSFGLSGPGDALFAEFGLTGEAVAEKVMAKLGA